jgi:hypothetical protein
VSTASPGTGATGVTAKAGTPGTAGPGTAPAAGTKTK